MTTAERRRRRRRGGGLRVPSDNVPRSSSPSVVPLPDDPALAIAYNPGTDPPEVTARGSIPEPVAPEAVTTLIDPPTNQPIEEISFESKTREMTAVDLEELGLEEQGERAESKPSRTGEMALHPSTVIVDEEIVRPSEPRLDAPRALPAPAAPPAVSTNPGIPPPPSTPAPAAPLARPAATASSTPSTPEDKGPAAGAAVPAVVMASAAPAGPTAPAAPLVPSAPIVPAAVAAADESPRPPSLKGRAPTLALSDDDLEELLDENRRQSASEVSDSAEFEVEMEMDASAVPSPVSGASEASAGRRTPLAAITASERADRTEPTLEPLGAEPRPSRALTPLAVPVVPLPTPQAEPAARAKSSSVPPPTPPIAPGAASNPAVVLPPPTPSAVGAPPPGRITPPPSPVKPPPAPPAPPKKAVEKQRPPAAAAAPSDDRKSRSKAWFAEVFDEDYLRTLPFLTPQATQAEAELVAASLGTSPGAKLLDVGCGYGRHAMELAARGYHVVGLDLSTPLLVRGGEEAHRRGLTINFIRGDMRELDFDGQFDGAYCLFSTFGYFDDETNKKTAGNIARALKPGGRCVFEILNRDYVIADLPTRVWWEGDGCVVLEEVDFNYFSSRINVNRSVVFDDGRQLEQEISIRAYSLHEVGKLMLAAGFRVLEVSGSYQTRGRFFGNQSRHIIVVAERAT